MLPQHSSTHVFSRWFGLAYRRAVSGILRWGNSPFYPPGSPFHWNRMQKSKAFVPLGSSCFGFRETPTVGKRQWKARLRLPNDRNGTGNQADRTTNSDEKSPDITCPWHTVNYLEKHALFPRRKPKAGVLRGCNPLSARSPEAAARRPLVGGTRKFSIIEKPEWGAKPPTTSSRH